MQNQSTSGVVNSIQLLDLTAAIDFRISEGTSIPLPLVVVVKEWQPGTGDVPTGDESIEIVLEPTSVL